MRSKFSMGKAATNCWWLSLISQQVYYIATYYIATYYIATYYIATYYIATYYIATYFQLERLN